MGRLRVLVLFFSLIAFVNAVPTTDTRIVDEGYPVERHTVPTEDGYILTLHRIPYSNRTQNQNVKNKPVIFIQHGFLSSSIEFVLACPEDSLAFSAADAGFDVWLGNFRGTQYSTGHITYSIDSNEYWTFGWHECGTYDLPAFILYVLNVTKQDSLHYVGHSMGTTTFLALMSTYPVYLQYIRTAHMLAPVAYMSNAKSVLLKILSSILGYPGAVSSALQNRPLIEYNEFISSVAAEACTPELISMALCGNVLFLLFGFDYINTNYTLIPDVYATHPDGASINQMIHYNQLVKSGRFGQFDFGYAKNLQIYEQNTPTEYPVERIKPRNAVQFYYSDNDDLSSPIDVSKLTQRMGNNAQQIHIDPPTWNHMTFVLGKTVKQFIIDVVLGYMRNYEHM